MESTKLPRFNWVSKSMRISNGFKDPNSTTVKLYNGCEILYSCVTCIVPKLNKGQQYTFIAEFSEGIPIGAEIALFASVQDCKKDRLVNDLYVDLERESKQTHAVTAYENDGGDIDDSSITNIVRTIIDDVRYELPTNFKFCMIFDSTDSTVKMSIVDTQFSIKKKFDKYSQEDQELLFSIINNSRKTLTVSINGYLS